VVGERWKSLLAPHYPPPFVQDPTCWRVQTVCEADREEDSKGV
jgi:hypothetical protein